MGFEFDKHSKTPLAKWRTFQSELFPFRFQRPSFFIFRPEVYFWDPPPFLLTLWINSEHCLWAPSDHLEFHPSDPLPAGLYPALQIEELGSLALPLLSQRLYPPVCPTRAHHAKRGTALATAPPLYIWRRRDQRAGSATQWDHFIIWWHQSFH